MNDSIIGSSYLDEAVNIVKEKRSVAKWGFGMAPISSRMRERYDAAVSDVSKLMNGQEVESQSVLESLSELKGMFNRYIRKDQWDYAMVGEELGNPPARHARLIANDLLKLRRALIADDIDSAEQAKQGLHENSILKYLENYESAKESPSQNRDGGWIYVLSTREQPNVLKIGRTDRPVSQRAKEINGATGVLTPFGARYVIRVSDPVEAERKIHQALGEYRIRQDREFFEVAPHIAEQIIRECIRSNRLNYRSSGTVLWFDHGKFYGFISMEREGDVFVHGSGVRRETAERLEPGTPVTFILNRNSKGPYATQVALSDEHGATERSNTGEASLNSHDDAPNEPRVFDGSGSRPRR